MPSLGSIADARILGAVWPVGLPAEEMAFLLTLTDERREQVSQRLQALIAAERGEASLGELAASLGITRTAFFNLRKRWSEERSLRVVSPWASRPRRFKKADGDLRPRAGDRLNAISADAANSRQPSAPTIRRLKRERARQEAAQPAALIKNFGQSLSADMTAVDIIIADGGLTSWLSCAFVIEPASGLILSWSDGPNTDLQDYRPILIAAQDEMTSLCIAARDHPAITIVIPKNIHLIDDLWATQTHEMIRNAGASASGLGQNFGSELLNSIGERIDTLRLYPGITRSGSPSEKQVRSRKVQTLEDGRLIVSRAVIRHNEPIRKRLTALGLIGAEGNPKALLSLIDRTLGRGRAKIGELAQRRAQ